MTGPRVAVGHWTGGRPLLTDEELAKRDLSDVQVRASVSLSPAEVEALRALWARLRRGADVAILSRSPTVRNLGAKWERAREVIERQKERRERIARGFPVSDGRARLVVATEPDSGAWDEEGRPVR